jgi:predicted enzyme related to lactoylglutathione lyase
MEDKRPTYANGKICYLQIPATDIETSASFYHKSFGWKLRRRSNDDISFDDGVGEVSGMWVLGKKPIAEAGIIISIMVDDAEATSKLILENGGKIVFDQTMNEGERLLHFLDPAGNIMGVYQESGN